ncbi:MAG: TIGR03668 family PPOX class F420-dependent oxidoreductase [Chloroflexi bacterium]|nr:TIGR03668 family PPOX class F420-dependent oxidoreductase [Chloroflexota bacterium]
MTDVLAGLLHESRRATLATIAADGRPRLVPCCFAVGSEDGALVIDTPIDAKPKAGDDPMRLARIQDILRDPRVTLLVDRWDEDWRRLAWLRIEGTARVLGPGEAGHDTAVIALRERYPQYATHPLETLPIIRITPTRHIGWTAADT